jgi:hypothetical protein
MISPSQSDLLQVPGEWDCAAGRGACIANDRSSSRLALRSARDRDTLEMKRNLAATLPAAAVTERPTLRRKRTMPDQPVESETPPESLPVTDETRSRDGDPNPNADEQNDPGSELQQRA